MTVRGDAPPGTDQRRPAPAPADQALVTRTPLTLAVTRRFPYGLVFRGRLGAGTVHLPGPPSDGTGVTFGLANAPIILKGVGASVRIPANVPWAIPRDGTWRLTPVRTTDLRLVHGDPAVSPGLVSTQRAVRWEGPEGTVMRAVIRSVTPVWVDDQHRPVADLVGHGPREQRTLGLNVVAENPDPDFASAFLMMAGWAVEKQRADRDPRLARVIAHIDRRIADPALSTASVATETRHSRRTLQMLFTSHGGVAAYIRRQRLAIVLRNLTADPDVFPDLDQVARASGLGSRRTLERTMHKVYGSTPLQARAHLLAGGTLTERTDPADRPVG